MVQTSPARAFEADPSARLTREDPDAFLTFSIGRQCFAVSVAPVREILDEQPFTPLPDSSSEVVGLIDARGEGVAVYDISHRLGVMPELERGRRIILMERKGNDTRPIGIIADSVLSVVELTQDEIEAPPGGRKEGGGSALVKGVARIAGGLVLVLDHRHVIGEEADDLFDFAS